MSESEFLKLLRSTLKEEIHGVKESVVGLEKKIESLIPYVNELAAIGAVLGFIQRWGGRIFQGALVVVATAMAIWWPEVLELVKSIRTVSR